MSRRRPPASLLALALGLALVATPAARARTFDSLAPIKRLQARQLALEPLEHRQERKEFAERQRELRRLAKRLKRGGQTSLHEGGERAKKDDREERLPAFVPSTGAAPSSADGALAPTNARCNNPAGDAASDGQCETSIVAWNQYMIAAWNDGKGFHDGSGQMQGWATSTDGGQTWTDRGYLPLPSGDANWSWTSDPVLAVNPHTGAFYFSSLVDPDGASGATNGIGVVKGRFNLAGSFAWEQPTLVRSVDYSSEFLDKQWIAVDPGTGRVYVSYTRFVSNVSEINFQAADSALSAWSAAVQISVSSNNAALDERGLVQGSRPVVGADGTVYVTYYRIGLVDTDSYRLARSTSFGASFSAPITIATFYPNFATGGPGFNRSMGIQFPSVAADHSNGAHHGRLFLAWAESFNWFDDLGSLGTAGGRLESEPNGNAGTATAFTVGQTLRGVLAVSGTEEDWFACTLAAGQNVTFMADSMGPGMAFSMRVFGPDGFSRLTFALASSGDIIGEVGPAFPFTAPVAGTYYLRLFPSSGFGGYRIRSGAAARGAERSRDQRDAFVSWSDDRGVSWSTPNRASDSPTGYDDWLPEVAVTADGHVYSAWYDFRDAPGSTGGGVANTYLARSDDGGTTWNPASAISSASSAWTSVNTNIQPNQGDYLSLFGDDRGVVGCWSDGRDGDPNAYMALTEAAMRADVTTARATSDSTVLVNWQLTPATSVFPKLYRRNLPGGAWGLLANLVESIGAASYEDTAVVIGATYEYQLGIVIDGEERYYGRVAVAMPTGPTPPRMAITGVFPNPVDRAAASAPRIAYRLRGTEPARIELLDIGGRLVHTYELGAPGPGAHEFALPAGGGFRPGVYLLRLVQGSEEVSRRISILR